MLQMFAVSCVAIENIQRSFAYPHILRPVASSRTGQSEKALERGASSAGFGHLMRL